MTAIITDALRKNVADLFLDQINDATDSAEFYIGIGKSDEYPSNDTLESPSSSIRFQRETRNQLQSVKKVTAASFVIPRNNWTSGTVYPAFSDTVTNIDNSKYYVLTEDNEVYICLQQGKQDTGTVNQSIIKPSYQSAGVADTQAFETSDGYRWKFLYALSATRASAFLSAGFMPIEFIDGSGSDAFQIQQKQIQNAATNGQIVGVEIVSGGSGYSSAPTITLSGDGTNAAATALVNNGSIVKVVMDNESAGMGSGYNFASASVTGNASLRPIIGAIGGIGANPLNDLLAKSLMFNTKPSGAEGGDFIIDTEVPFRQVSLVKNPEIYDSAAIYTGTTGRALRYLKMSSSSHGITSGNRLTGGTSGAVAFTNDVDSSLVYIHQNEDTGFVQFTDGETVTDSAGTSATVDSADKHSIVDLNSGELLYIENRAKITRSSAQTEDIKIVITV